MLYEVWGMQRDATTMTIRYAAKKYLVVHNSITWLLGITKRASRGWVTLL